MCPLKGLMWSTLIGHNIKTACLRALTCMDGEPLRVSSGTWDRDTWGQILWDLRDLCSIHGSVRAYKCSDGLAPEQMEARSCSSSYGRGICDDYAAG